MHMCSSAPVRFANGKSMRISKDLLGAKGSGSRNFRCSSKLRLCHFYYPAQNATLLLQNSYASKVYYYVHAKEE